MFETYAGLTLFHVSALSIFTLIYYSKINKTSRIIYNKNTKSPMLIFYVIVLTFLCGLRRTDGGGFGDTTTYVLFYEQASSLSGLSSINQEGEWIWTLLMYVFGLFTDVSGFFLFIAINYFIFHYAGCYSLKSNRPDILLLACLSNFSFLSYGTNGIRNGVACAILIYVLAIIASKQHNKRLLLTCGLLSFVAFNIHRSTALPLACGLVSYFYKDTKKIIYFWFLSIVISLVAGSTVEGFFSSLGFDDRMASYSQNHEYDYLFSNTGFRWDFLLYSFMPILLGYYIIFKRGISDEKYSYLLNTYIMCNSFWVMVIRTSSSNRFAYLSWFMYSIVLMYPLLNLPVFKVEHNRKTALIILAHTGFTVAMVMMGK